VNEGHERGFPLAIIECIHHAISVDGHEETGHNLKASGGLGRSGRTAATTGNKDVAACHNCTDQDGYF